MKAPKDHPRHESLSLREKIVDGLKKGIVTEQGLIAHGRGETFDYLLGEETKKEAVNSIKASVKLLHESKNPVLSINGNTAALVPEQLVKLQEISDIKFEVNLFHRSEERIEKIIKHLEDYGLKNILGKEPDKRIPGLNHDRAKVTEKGIFNADTVIVPLEDGDRTEKLIEMNKNVIAIDLNPLSRTSKMADITIVDNIARVFPLLIDKYLDVKRKEEISICFDNKKNLRAMEKHIRSGFSEDKEC